MLYELINESFGKIAGAAGVAGLGAAALGAHYGYDAGVEDFANASPEQALDASEYDNYDGNKQNVIRTINNIFDDKVANSEIDPLQANQLAHEKLAQVNDKWSQWQAAHDAQDTAGWDKAKEYGMYAGGAGLLAGGLGAAALRNRS